MLADRGVCGSRSSTAVGGCPTRCFLFPFTSKRSAPGRFLIFWSGGTGAGLCLDHRSPCCSIRRRPPSLHQLLARRPRFRFDAGVGPPLAYWLAETVFRPGGLPGVYMLAQICVSRPIGASLRSAARSRRFARGHGGAVDGRYRAVHRAVAGFWSPDPCHGAVGERRCCSTGAPRRSAAAIPGTRSAPRRRCCLLPAGLRLFCSASWSCSWRRPQRGREEALAISSVDRRWRSWSFCSAIYLAARTRGLTVVARRRAAARRKAPAATPRLWLRLLGALVLAHAGLACCWCWRSAGRGPAPRPGAGDRARRRSPVRATFVKIFALVPACSRPSCGPYRRSAPVGGAAPLLVLSGTRIMVAAGDSIALHHQRILGYAWAGPSLSCRRFSCRSLIVLLPWATGTELHSRAAGRAMGRFFAESFERRTGQPLAIVSGDPRTRRVGGARRAEPAERLFSSRTGALALGDRRDIRKKGAVWFGRRPTQIRRRRRNQSALSRSCPRSAAHFLTPGTWPAPAVADRLGHDQAGDNSDNCARDAQAEFKRLLERQEIAPGQPLLQRAGAAERPDGASPARGSRGCRCRSRTSGRACG